MIQQLGNVQRKRRQLGNVQRKRRQLGNVQRKRRQLGNVQRMRRQRLKNLEGGQRRMQGRGIQMQNRQKLYVSNKNKRQLT